MYQETPYQVFLRESGLDAADQPHKRVTSLPMLAFAGQIESAPISWEDGCRARDISDHHHVQHRIQHDFCGDEQAYINFVKVFGDRPRSTGGKPAVDQTPSDR